MIRTTYILISAILITVLTSCAKTEKASETSTQQNTDDRISVSKAQFSQNKMSLGRLEEQAFPVTVSVNGMIDAPPENRAIVSSTMGGYIKTTPLLEGDVVKKGQSLVTIENPEYVTMQQEYMEIKERLYYLKSEFDRQKTMFDENITSQKLYLQAESSYKTALAKYSGLKKQLTMLNMSPSRVENGEITSVIALYAPIDGSITKVNVQKGTFVSPATPIMEIINNEHLHLELSAFEKDIMNIKKGQHINFTIPEASKEIFKAEVHLVGTTLDEKRTVKVHAHPIEDAKRFLIGMFVNAEIITNEKNAVVLPETAVVEVENAYYVLVLDKDDDTHYFFNQVKVSVGNTVNGYTELKEYNLIQKTDQLLIKGAFNLIGNE